MFFFFSWFAFQIDLNLFFLRGKKIKMSEERKEKKKKTEEVEINWNKMGENLCMKMKLEREKISQLVNFCNFKNDKLILNKVLNEKGNVSNSIQMLGSIESLDVKQTIFVKIYSEKYVQDKTKFTSLLVEELIHKYALPFIHQYLSPHFVEFIGSKRCLMNESFLDQSIDLFQIPSEYISFFKSKFGNVDKNILRLLINEGLDESWISLEKFIDMEDEESTIEDYDSILFQILWSCLCLTNIDINHHDIHLNNIFIKKLDKPLLMYYLFCEKEGGFQWKHRYMVKIIDFDQATWKNVVTNTIHFELSPFSVNQSTNNNKVGWDDIYRAATKWRAEVIDEKTEKWLNELFSFETKEEFLYLHSKDQKIWPKYYNSEIKNFDVIQSPISLNEFFQSFDRDEENSIQVKQKIQQWLINIVYKDAINYSFMTPYTKLKSENYSISKLFPVFLTNRFNQNFITKRPSIQDTICIYYDQPPSKESRDELRDCMKKAQQEFENISRF